MRFLFNPEEIKKEVESLYIELQNRERYSKTTDNSRCWVIDKSKVTKKTLGDSFDRVTFVVDQLIGRGRKYGINVSYSVIIKRA